MEAVKAMLRSSPITERISDDWGDPDLTVRLEVEPDRANLAGITNSDVAYSTALALNGVQMTALREALLDAGIVRRRPVLITAGATILALGPPAIHGGPLWQPLC